MSVTLTLSGTVFRSSRYNREIFRQIGVSCAGQEFGASLDIVPPFPTFPKVVPTPNVTVIKALFVTVMGGSVKIRVAKAAPSYQTIDLEINKFFCLVDVPIESIFIMGVPDSSPNGVYVDIYGVGD